MVKRFLRYSLEKERKISVILSEGEKLKRRNLQVTSIDGEDFKALFAGAKKEKSLPISSVLTADYARGDHGDLE